MLGLDDAIYLLTAGGADTAGALIHWYEKFGLTLMEGFGQTEAMGLLANSARTNAASARSASRSAMSRSGSPRKTNCAASRRPLTGYYKQPDKTAETFKDGWVHTGDKARIDEDGFVYITGRVKDYFKTIQGKFVAPTPIENEFSKNPHTEQLCLLGRGYSKTVMVCVLSGLAQQAERENVEAELREMASQVNQDMRINALAWVRSLFLPTRGPSPTSACYFTMKIRREQIEAKYGDRRAALAATWRAGGTAGGVQRRPRTLGR